MCFLCCFVLYLAVHSPKRRASYSSSSEQHSLDEEDGSSTLAYKECVEQFTSGAWPCNADRAAKVSEKQKIRQSGQLYNSQSVNRTIYKVQNTVKWWGNTHRHR